MDDEEPQVNLRVHFWDSGHAQYDGKNNIITLPDPEFAALHGGPDYEWTGYWQTVAHETAHKIIWDWFGGINHREVFYAVLIALCSHWDLPPKVMDSEISYHGRGYKNGKKLLAAVALDRIHRISTDQDCDNRPLFDRQGCTESPCANHPTEESEVPEGQLTFHL